MRCVRMLRPGLAAVLLSMLVTVMPMFSVGVSAKEFDVTGTLDCGVRSGHICKWDDWDTGPVIGIITEDISGKPERVLVDASWVKKDMTDFGQDDFVWFTVRDDVGPQLQA